MGLEDRSLTDQLVQNLERRILDKLGSYALLQHRSAVVSSAVTARRALCDVYLGGDTSYASPNFINLTGETIVAGDRVLVVIDPRGDRYVDKLASGVGGTGLGTPNLVVKQDGTTILTGVSTVNLTGDGVTGSTSSAGQVDIDIPGGGGGGFGDGAAIVALTYSGNGQSITKNAGATFLGADAYDNILYDSAGFTGSVVAAQNIMALTDNYLAGSGQLTIPANGQYRILWLVDLGVGGTGTWDAVTSGSLYVTRSASSQLIDVANASRGSWSTISTSSLLSSACDVPLLAGDILRLKAQYTGSTNASGPRLAFGRMYVRQTG